MSQAQLFLIYLIMQRRLTAHSITDRIYYQVYCRQSVFYGQATSTILFIYDKKRFFYGALTASEWKSQSAVKLIDRYTFDRFLDTRNTCMRNYTLRIPVE